MAQTVKWARKRVKTGNDFERLSIKVTGKWRIAKRRKRAKSSKIVVFQKWMDGRLVINFIDTASKKAVKASTVRINEKRRVCVGLVDWRSFQTLVRKWRIKRNSKGKGKETKREKERKKEKEEPGEVIVETNGRVEQKDAAKTAKTKEMNKTSCQMKVKQSNANPNDLSENESK